MKTPTEIPAATPAQILRFYWQTAWRHKKMVIGVLIASPFTILINSILPPLIMAGVIQRLSTRDFIPHDIWGSFGPQLITYAVLIILGGMVMWRVVDSCIWRLEGRVQQDIARRVFNHLLSQSANFHANNFGGSLVSQTNKLLGAYIRIADTTIFQVIPMLLSIIFSAVVLAPRAPQFTAVLIVFSVLFIVSSTYVSRSVRKLSAKQAAAESKQTGYLADAVTNVMAIKSFAGSQYEQKQFNALTDVTRHRLLDMMWGSQKQQLFFGGLNTVILALSLTMAVVGVMTFNANMSTVFLIVTYTTTITQQLWQFGTNTLRTYNRALGDAQDMVAILGLTPEILDPKNPEPSRISKGAIAFNRMDFTHAESRDEDVLFKNLDLHITAGEKIGLVGHSGSGKTTLTKLLLRFNDVDGGSITIDGQNIAHITQDDLRRSIAYVPQEPLLFHRSIRDNIAYGK